LKKWTIFLVVFAAILGLLGYARYIEPNRVQVERVTIPIKNLPAALAGLTIVQLSDLELGGGGLRPREETVIERVNELEPDLIVITGDLIASSADFEAAADQAGEFVSRLKARDGVWVVRGDNDFVRQIERSDRLLEALQEGGAHVLVNQVVALGPAGAGLVLVGVDYMGFPLARTADFATLPHDGNMTLAAGVSEKNSYSHYTGPGAMQWQDYEFSGRMRYTDADGGVGVTFYSQLLDGFDAYYRLRRYQDRPEFYLAPHGTTVSGESLSTGVVSRPQVWYRFRIQVETQQDRTVMRANVWPVDEAEPADWQAVAYDDSPTRLSGGAIGLWSLSAGRTYFDDLKVNTLPAAEPDEIYMAEDFEAWPPGYDPLHWLDFGRDTENVRTAGQELPGDVPTIMLAHSSDLVLEAAKLDIDLVLSGGTHGGQIRLPFIGALYTDTDLGRGYSAGLYEFGETRLYISRGVGTSMLPLRFLSPPEITLITLSSAAEIELPQE